MRSLSLSHIGLLQVDRSIYGSKQIGNLKKAIDRFKVLALLNILTTKVLVR